MIIRRIHDTKFTTIYNQAIQDPGLSFKATGLLCYLLSLPSDWEVSGRQLATTKTDGRDSVFNTLKELEDAGYIHRYHQHVFDGTNLTKSGEDKGRQLACCDVTEIPHNFDAEKPPPYRDPAFQDSSDASHNKVLKVLQNNKQIEKKPGTPAHDADAREESPENELSGATDDEQIFSSLESPIEEQQDEKQTPKKPATSDQVDFIKRLANEKEVSEELHFEIGQFLLTDRSKDRAGEIIGILKAAPLKSNIITAILYNPTDSWIQKIPRETFEFIRDKLHDHHRGSQAVRPAVFDIDGKEYHLIAIDAYDPDKKAGNAGPDTDRAQDSVDPTVKAMVAEIVEATDATPIKEGAVSKGGQNTEPETLRPAPPQGQG